MTDDKFCKENCVGYRETGGRCFCDGECEAKRIHDLSVKNLLLNIKEGDVLYVKSEFMAPRLLMATKLDAYGILYVKFSYCIETKRLGVLNNSQWGIISDLEVRYATEEEKKELFNAIEQHKTGQSLIREIRNALEVSEKRWDENLETISKIKNMILKYENEIKNYYNP